MKLTKLIPLATIATAATVVTPLVTSCSGSSYTITDSNLKDYKLVDQKTGSLKASQATQAYFDDLSKNNKIFADDFFAPITKGISTDIIPPGSTFSLTVNVNKIDTVKHTISAALGAKVLFESELENSKYKLDIDLTVTITDVPFDVSAKPSNDDKVRWTVAPAYGEDPQKWQADNTWTASVRGYLNVYIDDKKDENESENFDKSFNHTAQAEDFEQIGFIIEAFWIDESYYLENVLLAAE